MARYTIDTFTSGSIPASSSGTVNHSLSSSNVNIYKIKVEPSVEGVSAQIEIYKKDTLLAGDLIYRSGEFSGTLIDTGEQSGASIVERNEGYLFPYEDEDGSDELHIKIINNDSVAKTYDFTIVYEPVNEMYEYRPLSGPTLWTDLADRDYWVPGYASTDQIEVTENIDGSITWLIPTDRSQYLTQQMSSVVLSRFNVFPDSDGLIEIRIKVSDVNLWGADYASRQSGMFLGLSCLANGNFIGTSGLAFNASKTAVNTLGFGAYKDYDRAPLGSFITFDMNLGTVGPGTFYGELIARWGMSRTDTTQYYTCGMSFPDCYYSLNGGAFTHLNVVGTKPPDLTQNGGYVFGMVIIAGFWEDNLLSAGNGGTLNEIELVKGYTANIM